MPVGHRRDGAAILGFLLLALLFFADLLFFDRAAFWGDVIMAFYPAGEVWRQAVLRGSVNPNGARTTATAAAIMRIVLWHH